MLLVTHTPAAGAVDGTPYGGNGALQVPNPVPIPIVPRAPQQRPTLHGPAPPGGAAVGTGSRTPDVVIGVFQDVACTPTEPQQRGPCTYSPGQNEVYCFHDLPPLTTIRGAIVVTDSSTTPAGMAMALANEHAPGHTALPFCITHMQGIPAIAIW